MNRILLSRRSKEWIAVFATSLGLMLLANRCEQNPIIANLPGSEWQLHTDMAHTMQDSVLYRTPWHGTSHTLYAGHADDGQREAGILIEFAAIDTATLFQLKNAELVLFRRPFSDDTPVNSSTFSLAVVESDTATWSELDTGLTIEDFPNVRPYRTSSMQVGLKTTFPDGIATKALVEHLVFELDSLLLQQWAAGALVNDGLLIRREDGGELVGFHSRDNLEFAPYIALGLHDTSASADSDTTIVQYYRPQKDLSIYPTLTDLNGMPGSSIQDGSIHLDYSNGLIGYLNFKEYIDLDTTSLVAGAKLVLHANEEQGLFLDSSVEILLARFAEPLADGDSSVVLQDNISYTTGDDSLVLNLGSYLRKLVGGSYDNFGLRLSIRPLGHDFDHLIFWGSQGPVGLRPKLEVFYATPFHEESQDE